MGYKSETVYLCLHLGKEKMWMAKSLIIKYLLIRVFKKDEIIN